MHGHYANYTFFRTKVQMSTPFLRNRPWNFAHVFYMSIPKPDLWGDFFSFLFRRKYLVQGGPNFQNNINWRKIVQHTKQKKTLGQAFVRALIEDVPKKFMGLDSQKRRTLRPGNEFLSVATTATRTTTATATPTTTPTPPTIYACKCSTLGSSTLRADERGGGYIASCFPNSAIGVFAIYQTVLGWKTCINNIMKPTNSPTQGQPNPIIMRSKVALRPLFPTSNKFWVGWDLFFI